MKRLAVTTCLVLLILSTSGCFRGRGLRVFGLRGAPCSPPKCVSGTCGATAVGSPVISAPSVTATSCPGGYCFGTTSDDIPPVYNAPGTIYGEENEVLPRGAESASASSLGPDIVFSRVLSDRKLTSVDGKLPEPKLDK